MNKSDKKIKVVKMTNNKNSSHVRGSYHAQNNKEKEKNKENERHKHRERERNREIEKDIDKDITILPIIENNEMTNENSNPFLIKLPSATGQSFEIGDLVIIIDQKAGKFSNDYVSVFSKLTKESSNSHLIGVVQSIDAHNLTNASFCGLLNYPFPLKPAKNYYLQNESLTENNLNNKQLPNRFMGTATSTNKIFWNPESP